MIKNVKSIVYVLLSNIKCNMKDNILKYIIFVAIFSVINVISFNNIYDSECSNSLFLVYKGSPYIKDNILSLFPFAWFIVNFFIIFIVGSNRNYSGKGLNLYFIVRCNKLNFWIGEIFYSMINVVIYYALAFSVTLILGKFLIMDSMSIVIYETIKVDAIKFFMIIAVLYVSTSMVAVLMQITFSLVIDKKYGFLINIILMILSVLTVQKILPYQHSLVLRHIPFNNMCNLSIKMSLIYNSSLFLIFLVLGYILILRKDFI